MKSNNKNNGESETTEEDVLEYLQGNPDFFLKNEFLLSKLVLDHDSGDATSLIERQISSLRAHNQKIQNQIASLVKVAQENEDIFGKIKNLSLSLFQVGSC